AAIAVLAAALAAPALAGGTAPLVRSAKVGGKGVVVDRHKRTTYVLTPETAKHLLCTATCLQFWRPVAAPKSGKLVKGAGITGKLGRLSRGSGSFQVTLRGLPIYTFVGDTKAGQTTGEGLTDFGAAWDALAPNGQSIEPNAPASGRSGNGSGW
ncbi:MAG: COG4315 family predicted lipoprotein, partial [Gaiellaceae bacterium]